MEVITLPVGQLQTNCYLAMDDDTRECFIIDPGDDANYISEKILHNNLKPQAVIATHGHFDHVLAAFELQLAFEIPFWIHAGDKDLLGRATDSARHWLEREIVTQPPKIDKTLAEGDILKIGKTKLAVLATPGHTPGGISLFCKKEKIVFVGDTIFKKGVGRTDFSYSSPLLLQESIEKIKEKLIGYTAYPGHGESFVIE